MALEPCLQAGSRYGKLCFSHDSRFLFCCSGSVVKVFNTTNGECMHDLQAHSQAVTGVSLNPSNVLQIISCGQDGDLIFWDYLDGVKLKVHNFHMPLYGIVFVNPDTKSMMIIAETSASRKTYSLMQWKRNKSNPNEFSKPKMLIEGCSKDYGLISFGCSREFVASGSKHMLTIYSMKKETKKLVTDNDIFNRKRPITCVACHPNEYTIATGLDNGKIIIWHNFFNDTQPVISRIHWHSLSVLCLEFTPDGSNLLSGGNECVLVKWQMSNTTQRDFKPRMGAPIAKVVASPDGSFYATQHTDNVVQLLNINFKILQVYRGLTRGNMGFKTNKNQIPCGLKYDPRSQALVTNGLPGHLQFYSLPLNRQLYNLDIVGQNYISPENIDRPSVITEITSAAISGTGEWLATYESWDDGHFTPETKLKFWSWSSEAQTYSLNTIVESPHEGQVTMMTFRPSSSHSNTDSCLVTVGTDHCFKTWVLVDDTDIYRNNMRWDCDSVGFYRGLEACCADFSNDGTSLAVGFGHLITLWDPDNNIVQKTLSNCLPDRQTIKHILYGNKDSSHLLVVATSKTLLVWDISTLEIQWKLETDISVLFKDPSSDIMAFTSKSCLQVFTPKSSKIIYEHQNVSSCEILDAIFIPNTRHNDIASIGWKSPSQIYLFNADEELLTLDLPKKAKNTKEYQVKIAQNLPQSALNAFLAEKMVREKDDGSAKILLKSHKKTDEEFISQLLYSNEPVSNICNQFLGSLLIKKSNTSSSKVKIEDMDESSSEEEMETNDKNDLIPQEIVQRAIVEKQEEDMNKLLSRPLDWVQWCASLKLE